LRCILLIVACGTLVACGPVKAVIKAPVNAADAVVDTLL
jgi:hypothetical protein